MMKIKYIKSTILILFIAIFVSACGDKEESETEKIQRISNEKSRG